MHIFNLLILAPIPSYNICIMACINKLRIFYMFALILESPLICRAKFKGSSLGFYDLNPSWHHFVGIDIYLWNKVVYFAFFFRSCQNFANHNASCHAFGIFGKLLMSALTWFGAIVWKLLIIEPFSKWKQNKIKT
jgi:hypothetical protein